MLVLTPDGLVPELELGAPADEPAGAAASEDPLWAFDDELGDEGEFGDEGLGVSGVACGTGVAGESGVAGCSGFADGNAVAGGIGVAGDMPDVLEPVPAWPAGLAGAVGIRGAFEVGGTGICCAGGVVWPGRGGAAWFGEGAAGPAGAGLCAADWASAGPIPAIARAAPTVKHRIVRIPPR